MKIDYNEKNIENVRRSINENITTKDNKVYIMAEKAMPCKVKVKQKSRVICAKSLLK